MILAGDVGGTSTRLAAYDVADGALRASVEQTYRSADYGSLNDIIAQFVAEHALRPTHACCGIAGPVHNNGVKTTNLPWFIEGASLARQLGLASFALINDLEANAWGVGALGAADLETLNAGEPGASGNAAVIAAGTGLGEAGLYWDGAEHRPFACEGGHADFAPRDELEIQMLRYLMAKFGRVSYERLVSGQGLCNIYEFLCQAPGWQEIPAVTESMRGQDLAAAISQAALENRSPVCVQALDMLVSIYGAEAGNVALKFMTYGGLFIGGGIAPKIITKLRDGNFMRAYLAKGRMQRIVAAMPVHVIMNPNTALLGAARCATRRIWPKAAI
ncbi:MAG: glucokinase [Steroidobacterales bacterium]